METLLVELTHKNALQLLKDLEAMDIIRLHDGREPTKTRLSEKYKGILPREAGEELIHHVNQVRSEWGNI
ncbi:hypothetical protein [Dyadobacter fermentans]|uniref:Uncharacterized protein n=1 Tax=Dyadobacter fermentans (strain ATCC 700827 / DSM 18053 / CIP 107007 / KCTC 52180 / NS114) TaxID=471854 RepID=C6W6J2_DYAFD|nr:hypothetical protein [Dyadobacter fermentans]ACT94332.1 hypothetical protein Dfer_3118 [Dyadobacter fermentans DSM 18053]